ncbi:glycoside hydrolase family 3 C-terminal domain-containing protein [Lacrimispora celerecrescens]|uniref:Beta-glucosidase n=1 Tax=[Clostridium] celerecrescens 18A TaxID=1286362 RepID=A0A2M8ZB13_9FIRM|nr:glycoside hydrolase family 3 C-terminal domain-containing protein [Lacrimispora celerecrescens]PJJ30626.1 beta-glucosidase [[Clostridium] celerecrescens 18A]
MKHTDIIEKMTIEEKAAILSGKNVWQSRNIDRLGIPSIFCADGPHGIRKQAREGDHLGLNASLPATCFPTAASISNSWDMDLCREIGEALGEEASALNVNVLLGPGLNIKRSPLCGRNFEYFSEDPYLSGKLAAAYIKGIQSQGVYACPKHFAVNSQELRRMAMNSVVDERTLREIYLEGFEIAVKEGGARSIMTSYNEVNGVYANENEHLLKDILRGEWGFDGIVITDWGGSNDHVKGVAAGSNLEMPSPGLHSARELIAAVENGSLSMEALEANVDDLLEAVFALTGNRENKRKSFDKEEHHKLAEKAEEESIVLLKNEDELLPLKPGCKVALIGDFAFTPRYQGAGSSLVNPIRVENMEEMIKDYPLNVAGCARGYSRGGKTDVTLRDEALKLAAQADVVLYCFGLDEISESEGMDRSHMGIPQNQISLLTALSEENPNVVGILSAGSAIEMPWHECCKSLLHGYLGGEAGPSAMLRVITGEVNPSGRLSETYPLRYEDTPAYRYFPGAERCSQYREGIYVGYRYYDTGKVKVQYPFGYGLSYTTFSYKNLEISENEVRFTLANTGKVDGKEVVQLYVGGPKGRIFRPEKELKGFKKVFLKAGESKVITIPFDDKTFRYWNRLTNRFEVEGGVYSIFIGANVADIRLLQTVTREGTTEDWPYKAETLKSYYTGRISQVSEKEFETLLGHPVPEGKWSGDLSLNDALCQMYYAKSPLARLVWWILTGLKNKSEEKGKPDLNLLFIYNMPFRGIAKMTGGAVSMDMAEGMVLAVNGHFFRGMRRIIGGYFANAKANRAYEKKLSGK